VYTMRGFRPSLLGLLLLLLLLLLLALHSDD
jgi:hypothetical protein